jgi:hypothetical protein
MFWFLLTTFAEFVNEENHQSIFDSIYGYLNHFVGGLFSLSKNKLKVNLYKTHN